MNYHNITKDDMLNGDGLRVVLWLSGCSNCCPGCQNPQTWDPNSGLLFDKAAYEEVVAELEKDYISGITLSGGDPLYPANREPVTELCKDLKSRFPNKTIWMYTGYDWYEVKDLPVMQYVDILVDGKFDEGLKLNSYHWAGSTNQRVINVQESLRTGELVIHEESKKKATWKLVSCTSEELMKMKCPNSEC